MQNLKRSWSKASKEEILKIKEKLEKFGIDLEKILKEFEILTFELRRKEVFVIRKGLADIALNISPYSAGITLGEFKGNSFSLSLSGGAFIHGYARKGRVFLDEEGELEFIYGKDVSGPSISSWDLGIEDGNLVLVLNSKGEYLGIGKAIVRNLRIVKVKNVIDIGWYLRSEIDEDKAL